MRQMATRLGISPRTVETHVAKLYRKLDVRTRDPGGLPGRLARADRAPMSL